jgi:hypothetical protein
MWYDSAAFMVGKRDVIVAWLVCLLVAAPCSRSLVTAAFDHAMATSHAAASCATVG